MTTPSGSVVDELLHLQRERLRRGLCVVCGRSIVECWCSEYERFDDWRNYSGDGDSGE